MNRKIKAVVTLVPDEQDVDKNKNAPNFHLEVKS